MKKHLLFPLLFFFFLSAKAQITLDTVLVPQIGLGMNFWIAQISATESKYYIGDTVTNTFSLYNMDFTPFITNIVLPLPTASSWYQILYITRTLFDCDSSNIEYMYTEPAGGCANSIYIMRTDGTQLFFMDSARSDYCAGGCLGLSDMVRPIVNTSDHARLFIRHPLCGPDANIFIYSLCGSLPVEVFDLTNLNQSLVKIFPNPSSGSLTFQISPPDNMNDYELVIIDNNAKEARREKINSGINKYVIDVSNFSNGTYFYSLCTKNKAYQSGKFILTK